MNQALYLWRKLYSRRLWAFERFTLPRNGAVLKCVDHLQWI